MNIIKTLQNKNKGNSIIDVLYGHDISDQLSDNNNDNQDINLMFNSLGELINKDDLTLPIELGASWSLDEDSDDLVVYYKGKERWRFEH